MRWNRSVLLLIMLAIPSPSNAQHPQNRGGHPGGTGIHPGKTHPGQRQPRTMTPEMHRR
jgi:hypothetical protein